jgi:hypothetical protein
MMHPKPEDFRRKSKPTSLPQAIAFDVGTARQNARRWEMVRGIAFDILSFQKWLAAGREQDSKIVPQVVV